MTPTEQDKELFRLASLIGCEPQDEERRRQQLADYITADRKRAELKARLNEIQNAYEYWINGRKFISSYFRHRIAELSNTRESK